jgi:hypothetical protein
MRNKILEYAKSQELSAKETGSGAYDISFDAKPNFKVTITVPFFVLEWSLSVRTRDDNNEIFSDSCEHFGDRDETKLEEEMEEAVINTIKSLNNADIRITKTSLFQLFKWRFFKREILEVKTDAGWVNFWELALSTFKND